MEASNHCRERFNTMGFSRRSNEPSDLLLLYLQEHAQKVLYPVPGTCANCKGSYCNSTCEYVKLGESQMPIGKGWVTTVQSQNEVLGR